METVLVTGASRGIGRGVLASFAGRGYYLIGTATSADRAEFITDFIHGLDGAHGHGEILDVSERDSILELSAKLKTQSQLPAILVNNAGIVRDALLLRMSSAQWDEVISTNLCSVFHLCKAFCRSMMKKKWGRIVNITSVSAIMGNVGQCNYAASKAGVTGFTKSLARELSGRAITVNCVSPGFIDTDMTKSIDSEVRHSLEKNILLGRFGRVEEVAAAVFFLCSRDASYITGQTVHVNGGLAMV